ncbi:hypothetical protein ACIRCZ_18695 [Leifsonia sp. NPDC102414]|uniref:hypothetical protein n=1 Tax=Leifsonia sp. NPDC102414 TaxID=3364124 RepID=UPI0037F59229
MLQRLGNPSARHLGKRRNRLVAAGLSFGLVIGAGGVIGTVSAVAPISSVQTADAATETPLMVHGASTFGGDLGFYDAGNNQYGICADSARAWPSGTTGPASVNTSFTSDSGYNMSDVELTGANATLSALIPQAVSTNNPTLAAALNAFVYAFTGSNLGGGVERGTFEEGAGYISNSHPEILAAYSDVWNYYLARNTPTSGATTSTPLTFQVDANNYTGTMTVPADVLGSVDVLLTNGVFPATGTNTITGLAAGAVVQVRGVAPDDNTPDWEISAVATVHGQGGAKAELTQWETGSQQRLIAGTGATNSADYQISGHDPVTRTSKFAPVLGTAVTTKFYKVGDKPQDDVTFSTVPFDHQDHSRNNPWYQSSSGAYFPVTATGTLYGPSPVPFAESDTVPAGALVAGHATVTTDKKTGPTVKYTATSDTAVVEAGYYTWVWGIDGSAQPASTQLFLPDAYSFTDRFGQVAETSVVATGLSFSTKLSDTSKAITGTVTDTITPTIHNGAWLQDGGARVPAKLTGQVYWMPTKPVQSPTPNAGAELIGTVSQTLGGPTAATSPSFSVGNRPGYVTVQWSLKQSDQPAKYAGYFTEFTDDFGVPAETVQVVGPTVTTKAQPLSGPGSTVQDTATITGPIPDGGVDTSFAGYLQPEDSTSPVCTEENRIYLSTKPVHADKPGDYPSEKFPVLDGQLGTVFWVETTTLPGTDTVISTGKCGQPGETTLLIPPTVTTVPPTGLVEGDTATDTAIVNGPISDGSTLEFDIYGKKPGETVLVCDDDHKVGETTTPIPVTPGMAEHAEYTSPESGPLPAGDYGYVETLRDKDKNAIVTGGCHDEPFTVSTKPVVVTPPNPPALANTGSDTTGIIWAGGAAAIAVIALGVIITITRRRRTTTIAPVDTTGTTEDINLT